MAMEPGREASRKPCEPYEWDIPRIVLKISQRGVCTELVAKTYGNDYVYAPCSCTKTAADCLPQQKTPRGRIEKATGSQPPILCQVEAREDAGAPATSLQENVDAPFREASNSLRRKADFVPRAKPHLQPFQS